MPWFRDIFTSQMFKVSWRSAFRLVIFLAFKFLSCSHVTIQLAINRNTLLNFRAGPWAYPRYLSYVGFVFHDILAD